MGFSLFLPFGMGVSVRKVNGTEEAVVANVIVILVKYSKLTTNK